MRMRHRIAVVVVIVFCAVTSSTFTTSGSAMSAASFLSRSDVFPILASERNVESFRLRGIWTGSCDSMSVRERSPVDCLQKGALVSPRSAKAIPGLIRRLQRCTWVRYRGQGLRGFPTLGFHFGGDSLNVDLVVWVLSRKASLSRVGEGWYTADIPESLLTDVVWCLWGVDSENPDLVLRIEAEMNRRGSTLLEAPPSDVLLVDDVRRSVPYDYPPVPTRRVDPVYPEMAREARVEGQVILRVLIDKTGRLKDVKVRRSVTMLDGAAVDAVKHWAFEPGVLDGRPVDVWFDIPVDFHLDP